MIKLDFIEINAKNYSLKIEDAIKKCPDLEKYLVPNTKKFDLGNSQALVDYNKCLFRILDGLSIEIPPEHLIPTAGLRRCIVDILCKELNPESILEIGTGTTAIIVQLFALKGIKTFATEMDTSSIEIAKKNIKNNLKKFQYPIKIFHSKGGIIQWLIDEQKDIFPIGLALSLPPYYMHGSKDSSKTRGFLGTKYELFSFVEAEDFSVQLIKEWESNKDSLTNIAILWKNQDSFNIAMDHLGKDYDEMKLYRITSGTRKRILSIHK